MGQNAYHSAPLCYIHIIATRSVLMTQDSILYVCSVRKPVEPKSYSIIFRPRTSSRIS